MDSVTLRSASALQTQSIGGELGTLLRAGDVVSLTGELGAGKTCLVQGAAAALGVSERVTSPSFLLRKDYVGQLPIVHMDVYRLHTLGDVLDLGWDEAADGRVVFVEWGDAMQALLPQEYLEVAITSPGLSDDDSARRITLRAHGQEWIQRLNTLAPRFAQWVEQD